MGIKAKAHSLHVGASPYVLSEFRSSCSWATCEEDSTSFPSDDLALFLDVEAPFASPPPPPSPSAATEADGEDGCCCWASGLSSDSTDIRAVPIPIPKSS